MSKRMRRICGVLLLAMCFIVLFVLDVIAHGWVYALISFLLFAALGGALALGAYLLTYEEDE